MAGLSLGVGASFSPGLLQARERQSRRCAFLFNCSINSCCMIYYYSSQKCIALSDPVCRTSISHVVPSTEAQTRSTVPDAWPILSVARSFPFHRAERDDVKALNFVFHNSIHAIDLLHDFHMPPSIYSLRLTRAHTQPRPCFRHHTSHKLQLKLEAAIARMKRQDN